MTEPGEAAVDERVDTVRDGRLCGTRYQVIRYHPSTDR